MDLERFEARLFRAASAYYLNPVAPTKKCLSEVKRILRAERHGIDPDFVTKHPKIHKYLMQVHKALKAGEPFLQDLAEDDQRDPLIRTFQSSYRALKGAMTKLRDYYREFGEIGKKWVLLVQKSMATYWPALQSMVRSKSKTPSR